MGWENMRNNEKTWFCPICNKWFHPLGVARHRAMHRDKENEKSTQRFIDTAHLHGGKND